MLIAIAGYNGFLGNLLNEELQLAGHKTIGISRDTLGNTEKLSAIIGTSDVVINLAGANIGKRWTNKYKQQLISSRVTTTRLLVLALNAVKKSPKLFISISGIGIYDGTHNHTESSQQFSNNFLGNLCQQWEIEAQKVKNNTTRVVILRTAPVFSFEAGILNKLIPVFKLGLGASMGNGKQAMPWIAAYDFSRIVMWIIVNNESQGVYNVVAPKTPTNKEFSHLLAKKLKRPLFFKIPKSLLKLVFGEMSVLFLHGQRAKPERLMNEGFSFKYKCLDDFLK